MNRERSRATALAWVVGTLIGLAGSGCTSSNVLLREDVELRDGHVVFPGVRANFDVLADRSPPRQGLVDLGKPSAVETSVAEQDAGVRDGAPASSRSQPRRRARAEPRLAIDVEYAAGSGANDAQSLSRTTDYVDYDGSVFNGPGVLQSRYDLHLATVGVRGGGRFLEVLSLEGLGGLSITALDLEIRDAGTSASDTGVSIGAHLGARVSITPHPIVDLYAEGKLHLLGGLQQSRGKVLLSAAEVGGNLHLTSNVSVFGGYRWWSYFEDIHSASDIDDIILKGPTFGLLLRF